MTLTNIALCESGNIMLCDNGNISFCPVLVELTHCNNLAHSSCDGSEASIITELEASHVGKVVRIGGVCYSVATVESGTPVAVTIDEVYDDCAECCGDLAPCSCPCTSWLPPSWPCNGLLEEYSGTNNEHSIIDGDTISGWFYTTTTTLREARWKTAFNAVAFSNPYVSCIWQFPYEIRVWGFSDGEWSTFGWQDSGYQYMQLDTSNIPCFWVVRVFGLPLDAEKYTGVTPVGIFQKTALNPAYPNGIRGMANVTVTEAT